MKQSEMNRRMWLKAAGAAVAIAMLGVYLGVLPTRLIDVAQQSIGTIF